MIDDLVKEYGLNYTQGTLRPNFIHIPVNRFDTNAEGADKFNVFYKAIMADKEMTKLTRTKSGGVSIKGKNLMLPAYDLNIQTSIKGIITGLELVIITGEVMCRLQFCGKPEQTVAGSVAFKEFKKVFKDFNINLDDYAVEKEEGIKCKDQIKSALIKLDNPVFRDMTFYNCHHLDFHSSYPTGLINTHPEFRKPIEWMYENRKVTVRGFEDYYKGVMNSTIGYMQSKYCGYKYTNLARDAINDNYERITALAKRLEDSGRMVILYNTDGIWYQGDLYHDENEGKGLGTWQNDHINCKLRAKSDGAYEYMEDGKYYPVVRGATLLDRVKPRTEWEWGDIYNKDAQQIIFKFDKEEGITYGKETELHNLF